MPRRSSNAMACDDFLTFPRQCSNYKDLKWPKHNQVNKIPQCSPMCSRHNSLTTIHVQDASVHRLHAKERTGRRPLPSWVSTFGRTLKLVSGCCLLSSWTSSKPWQELNYPSAELCMKCSMHPDFQQQWFNTILSHHLLEFLKSALPSSGQNYWARFSW